MKILQSRYKVIFLLVGIFISVSFTTRTILLLKEFHNVDLNMIVLFKTYFIGLFYDIIAVSYYVPFIALYLILVPNKIYNSKLHQYFTFAFLISQIYIFIFNGISEWFFWDEFGKRFNFIAVDYLVYTHEVIDNILESYPIPLITSGIFILSFIIFIYLYKKYNLTNYFIYNDNFTTRLKQGIVFLILPFIMFNVFNKQPFSKISDNQYNNELSKNGFYSLFSAFRNNTLDYYEFYKTLDDKVVLKELNSLESFNDKSNKIIQNDKKEKHYNIMLVMVESLSAEYMGIYGNKNNWTPNLDKLTKKSLFFDNFYATGTRTVRGMEAVTLSVPPTPGRSIVKRPDEHQFNSVATITKKRGYENKFIYAGHGYFDNMNSYFSNSGFKTIDRTDFKDDEITFSNVWGACDEDLFNKSLKEADKSYDDQKPFFNFIMTTSNHRPYTYPDDKIDIPSHTGRGGAVKYTDYAIDNFIKKASKKPWFTNTIFVIVADHNGGSAGKTSLPIHRYKIPLILYAPDILKPQVISKLSSQVDIMPTIFSLMNWSYESKFYGNDILDPNFTQRAFIGNYQKLGYVTKDNLIVLSANKTIKRYKIVNQTLNSSKYKELPIDKELEKNIITYYQSASFLYSNGFFYPYKYLYKKRLR